MDCIFCKFASHEVEDPTTFYEDSKVFVKLDSDWAVKGHSLVVWKEHALNMSDLNEEDFAHFSKIVRKTEAVLLKIVGVDKSIVLKSGGIVSHFHFHIYPVRSDMPWEDVLALFRKEVRNEPKAEESRVFVQELQTGIIKE
jgi:histidine triad (HIT) family protein